MEKHFCNEIASMNMPENTKDIHLGTKQYSNGNNNISTQTREIIYWKWTVLKLWAEKECILHILNCGKHEDIFNPLKKCYAGNNPP